MKFFRIIKKPLLYSAIFFIVACLSFYLYLENGAKIHFPKKERIELIQQIKSAPKLPDNFIEFYNGVYPESLENNFWKKTYHQSTSRYLLNNNLPSQNVANLAVGPFLQYNKRSINNAVLIRNIEKNTTQTECLNFIFKNFDFLYNRKGIEDVSQDLFNKNVKDLNPIEMAEIVALTENPVRNDRYRNPERAKMRSEVLLNRYQNNSILSQK